MNYAIANWKMNTTLKEGLRLAQGIKSSASDSENTKVIICPPFMSLEVISSLFEISDISVGAQNMHYEESGAYTGEISPSMLQEYVDYVIIGHSERRNIFNETDELIQKKVKSALDHDITPILCIGESKETYDSKETYKFLENQLKNSLKGINKDEIKKIIFAYEPIWAIGSGSTPDKNEIEQITKFIELTIQKFFLDNATDSIPILYGGSVTSFNVLDFVSLPHVQGVLVGGASLDAEEFAKIITRIQSL